MKKRKMIFTATTIISLVVGGLAFRFHKTDASYCYDPTGVCFTCRVLQGFYLGGVSRFCVTPVPPGGCRTNTRCTGEIDATIEE